MDDYASVSFGKSKAYFQKSKVYFSESKLYFFENVFFFQSMGVALKLPDSVDEGAGEGVVKDLFILQPL